jgi:predicted nuclease with TOPRIM domain
MTKADIKSIEKKIKEIEKLKESLSGLRDKIREAHEELECLLESVDTADSDISMGISLIKDGIDSISQYV